VQPGLLRLSIGLISATLDPTSEDPQPILGACRALDSLASEKYPSEKTIRQLEGVGEVDVKNANYILHLSGKCKYSRNELSHLTAHSGQTSNYNTQRSGPTFHPSTLSDLSFLDR